MNAEKIQETFSVMFRVDAPRSILKTARLLQKEGARRSSDVIFLPRDDDIESWQSDSFGAITFRLRGEDQYLDDDEWDELIFEYPLVAVPENWAEAFIAFAKKYSAVLGLPICYEGEETPIDIIRDSLLSLIRYIRERYFSPGSEELRWQVESQYG